MAKIVVRLDSEFNETAAREANREAQRYWERQHQQLMVDAKLNDAAARKATGEAKAYFMRQAAEFRVEAKLSQTSARQVVRDAEKIGKDAAKALESGLSAATTAAGGAASALTSVGDAAGGIGAAGGPAKIAALGAALLYASEIAATAAQSIWLLPAAAGAAGAAFGTLALGTQGFGDAMKNMGDPKKFAESLQTLAPSAQQAATSIKALVDGPLKQLQQATQQSLFAGVGPQLEQLTAQYLPSIQRMTTGIADSFNGMFKGFSTQLMSPETSGALQEFMSNVTNAFKQLAPAVAPLTRAFADIMAVGSGFLPDLAKAATSAAKSFGDFISEARQSGKLKEWLGDGLNALKLLGGMAIDAGKAFASLAPIGKQVLPDIATGFHVIAVVLGPLAMAINGLTPMTRAFGTAIESVAGSIIPKINMITGAINKLIEPIRYVASLAGISIPNIPAIAQPDQSVTGVTPGENRTRIRTSDSAGTDAAALPSGVGRGATVIATAPPAGQSWGPTGGPAANPGASIPKAPSQAPGSGSSGSAAPSQLPTGVGTAPSAPSAPAASGGRAGIANMIYQAALARGYSAQAATAIVAYAIGESGLNPGISGGQQGDDVVIGLFQEKSGFAAAGGINPSQRSDPTANTTAYLNNLQKHTSGDIYDQLLATSVGGPIYTGGRGAMGPLEKQARDLIAGGGAAGPLGPGSTATGFSGVPASAATAPGSPGGPVIPVFITNWDGSMRSGGPNGQGPNGQGPGTGGPAGSPGANGGFDPLGAFFSGLQQGGGFGGIAGSIGNNILGQVRANNAPGFAAGGGVDTIPAMLAPGEHVLTAKDVAAMGGQQGVYGFRNALHAGGVMPLGNVGTDGSLTPGDGQQNRRRILWWGGKDGLPPGAGPNDPLLPWGPDAKGKMTPPNIFGGLPGEENPKGDFPNPGDPRQIWWHNRRGVQGFAGGGKVEDPPPPSPHMPTPSPVQHMPTAPVAPGAPGSAASGQGSGPPPGPSPVGGGEPKNTPGGAQSGGGVVGAATGAAAMAADMFAPGSGAAVQIASQEAQRAIKFAGQATAIGIGGLIDTFLPFGGSDLAQNNWGTRVASGFAGVQPQIPNTAGKSASVDAMNAHGQAAPPMAMPDPISSGRGSGPPPGPQITNHITLNNNGAANDPNSNTMGDHLTRQYENMPGQR